MAADTAEADDWQTYLCKCGAKNPIRPGESYCPACGMKWHFPSTLQPSEPPLQERGERIPNAAG